MTKPLTKAQVQLKKCRRLKDKGLHQLLLHRFLHHYGYDKGEVTATAIIDDIRAEAADAVDYALGAAYPDGSEIKMHLYADAN